MNLKEIYQKSIPDYNRGHIHHILYYIISVPFIWLLIKLKIKANTVTIMSILLRIVSLYCYFLFYKIPAIILFQIGYILDCSDGAIARITNNCSNFGKFLDIMLDHIIKKFFPVALAVGLYFYYKEAYILIIALVLYAFVMLREAISITPERNKNQKEEFSDKRKETKSKYSIFSRIFIAIIDFNKVFFPFIILFNIKIIFAFYLFNIFTEFLRIIFDFYSVFRA